MFVTVNAHVENKLSMRPGSTVVFSQRNPSPTSQMRR